MGIYMHVYSMDRCVLERLVHAPIRDVVSMLGLQLELIPAEFRDRQDRDEHTVFARRGDEPLLDHIADLEAPLSAHLADAPSDLVWLLDWVSQSAAIDVQRVVDGHRRWWVGSLACELERCGFRDDPVVGAAFARLRSLVDLDSGCPSFDAIAPIVDGVLTLGRREEAWIGEVPSRELAPLLLAASRLDVFAPPNRHDPATWERVAGNVAALSSATQKHDHLISVVA